MGNCHSRDKPNYSVTSPQSSESIRLSDESLKNDVLSIPIVDHGAANKASIDCDTLGRLTPCEKQGAHVHDNGFSGNVDNDSQSSRRQLTNDKKHPYFNKLDGATSGSHALNTPSSNMEGQAVDKFKKAIDMWSNFKISSNAVRKLHGVTDAWSYFDMDHVPLPQSVFGSNSSDSFDAPLDKAPSQCNLTKSDAAATELGNTTDVFARRKPPAHTNSSSWCPNTNGAGELNWLNYELVLRPYMGGDNSRYTYTCTVRPRCEAPSCDKTYHIDEGLVQMLGEILDPFQLHSYNENRLKVMTNIKRLLRTAGHDSSEGDVPTDGSDQSSQRTVHRKSRSHVRRTDDLRYLSTISDNGACSKGKLSPLADCVAPLGLSLDDAICLNMDPHKPCRPNFRRRNKRGNHFGDMSDIPLLF